MFWGSHQAVVLMVLGAAPPPTPKPRPPTPGPLACGADVQLTLEDVVDDRLTQVVHDVAVPVLQGQSDQQRAQVSRVTARGRGYMTDKPLTCFWWS